MSIKIMSVAAGRGFSLRILLNIFTILLLISSLFSCSPYKNEISNRTDAIIESILQADYSDIPGLSDALSEMDDSAAADFKSMMSHVEKWNVSVSQKQGDRVTAAVYLTIKNDDVKILHLSYRQIDHQWALEDRITFSQTIDFIPLKKK